MIKIYEDVPDRVAAFRVSGDVTAADYENVLIPLVQKKFATHNKIGVLYHADAEFKGFTSGAIWDDAKTGIKHLTGWERIAVVSDVSWLRNAVVAMKWMIPTPVRLFGNDELAAAKRWVAET